MLTSRRDYCAARKVRAMILAVALGLVVANSPAPSAAGKPWFEPRAGRVLVAAPQLIDPNFAGTVVLLLTYSEDGAMGVVVNRPSKHRLAEALPWAAEYEDRNDLVYLGGPVQRNMMVLLFHAQEELPESLPVTTGIWMTGSQDTLKQALESGIAEREIRAFAGYAGWGPGQLDAELARDDWKVLPARPAEIFSDQPLRLWKTLMERALLPFA